MSGAGLPVVVRPWQDRYGTTRLYVRNLPALIGLEITKYGTGNIARVSLNGETIPNAAARRIIDARVWISDGEIPVVHVDNWREWKTLSADGCAAIVRAAIEAHGISR